MIVYMQFFTYNYHIITNFLSQISSHTHQKFPLGNQWAQTYLRLRSGVPPCPFGTAHAHHWSRLNLNLSQSAAVQIDFCDGSIAEIHP